MTKEIKCLMFYSPDGTRACSLAAAAKMEYLFSCWTRLGYRVRVLSACKTIGTQNTGREIREIQPGVTVEFVPCLGRGGKMRNVVSAVCYRLALWMRMASFVKPGEILWVYHALPLRMPLQILKMLRRFSLILEMEELYGDAAGDPKIVEQELRFAKMADGYLFPAENLNRLANPDGKPFVICHGSYRLSDQEAERRTDEKIHVVYAGTMDPKKGGAAAALEAARYLPEEYHLHILGQENKQMMDLLGHLQNNCRCGISYDGQLRGADYERFLQNCRIGLSTQNTAAGFNKSSFPSKILSYLGCGLQVVSGRIPAVEESPLAEAVCFYDSQSPKDIASAIMDAAKRVDTDNRDLLRRLDAALLPRLKMLLDNVEARNIEKNV